MTDSTHQSKTGNLSVDNKVFETWNLIVYHNTSGEVFIKNKNSGVTIRVSDSILYLQITASDGVFSPWSVNGLPAILVKPE